MAANHGGCRWECVFLPPQAIVKVGCGGVGVFVFIVCDVKKLHEHSWLGI